MSPKAAPAKITFEYFSVIFDTICRTLEINGCKSLDLQIKHSAENGPDDYSLAFEAVVGTNHLKLDFDRTSNPTDTESH